MIAGWQKAKILEHRGHWSASGTPAIRLKFVMDGPDGEESIIGYIWLSEKAYGMARKSLRSCGFDIDTQDVGQLDENQTLLMGNEVSIEIQEETFNGRTAMKVVNIGGDDERPKDAKAQFSRLTQALRDVKKTEKAVVDPKTCKHKKIGRKDGKSFCKDCDAPIETPPQKPAAPASADPEFQKLDKALESGSPAGDDIPF